MEAIEEDIHQGDRASSTPTRFSELGFEWISLKALSVLLGFSACPCLLMIVHHVTGSCLLSLFRQLFLPALFQSLISYAKSIADLHCTCAKKFYWTRNRNGEKYSKSKAVSIFCYELQCCLCLALFPSRCPFLCHLLCSHLHVLSTGAFMSVRTCPR